MANNILLDTLREHRQEIGEEQQQASALVAQCQEEIEHRRASLKNTTEQADWAAYADERTHAQYRALLAHYVGLREKPPVLLAKITTLQAEQSRTAGNRRHTSDITQQRQQGLHEAESRLAVAEQNFMLIQKALQDITEHIQCVQRGDYTVLRGAEHSDIEPR
jgi:chromosome segregation ATPase